MKTLLILLTITLMGCASAPKPRVLVRDGSCQPGGPLVLNCEKIVDIE